MNIETSLANNNRFTHKGTGIIWRCGADAHTTAPFTLQLHSPKRRGATFHRFVTAHHRERYIARCIENAARIDRHVAANFYPTPPEATRALLSVEAFDGPIWEPACGEGHIAKVLEEHGHDVIATDLNQWGYGRAGIDFLAASGSHAAPRARHIVTNPPYGQGLADAFIDKARAVTARTGGKVAMLLNLASLAHAGRTEAWRRTPPARLYAVDGVVCWPDKTRKPPKHFLAHRYVWAIWEHGHSGPSAFWWLSAGEFRAETTAPRQARDLSAATALLMRKQPDAAAPVNARRQACLRADLPNFDTEAA